jgi:hypothetical protein
VAAPSRSVKAAGSLGKPKTSGPASLASVGAYRRDPGALLDYLATFVMLPAYELDQ